MYDVLIVLKNKIYTYAACNNSGLALDHGGLQINKSFVELLQNYINKANDKRNPINFLPQSRQCLRTHLVRIRTALVTLYFTPKAWLSKQTNASEIERSARNWQYTFSLQNPFLITTTQIKMVYFFISSSRNWKGNCRVRRPHGGVE